MSMMAYDKFIERINKIEKALNIPLEVHCELIVKDGIADVDTDGDYYAYIDFNNFDKNILLDIAKRSVADKVLANALVKVFQTQKDLVILEFKRKTHIEVSSMAYVNMLCVEANISSFKSSTISKRFLNKLEEYIDSKIKEVV